MLITLEIFISFDFLQKYYLCFVCKILMKENDLKKCAMLHSNHPADFL